MVYLYAQSKGLTLEVIPAQYGDAPPDVTDKRVYIVDFSYSRDDLVAMYWDAEELHVYDHHVTAREAVEGLPFGVYDVKHSGAVITWMQLFPDTPVPPLLKVIEDRDLWTRAYPETEAVSAALFVKCRDITEWAPMIAAERLASMRHIAMLEGVGKHILAYKQKLIDCAVANAERMTFAGFSDIPVVNATSEISEIGDELAQDASFAVMYYDVPGKRIFSLRSNGDEGEDVGDIAKRFGGGGHRNAAGFYVNRDNEALEW